MTNRLLAALLWALIALPLSAHADTLTTTSCTTNCTFTTPSLLGSASPPVALAAGSIVSVNAAAANNFTLTATQNFTLDNPTNLQAGQTINYWITQDSVGNRIMTLGSYYQATNKGAKLMLSRAAGAQDFLSCKANTTTSLSCVLNPNVSSSLIPVYVGPGDLQGSASFWYGLRAYSGEKAAAGVNAVAVRRTTDNATQILTVLQNGLLDVATATTFAGTTAQCTGTISTTTLTVSACASGTLATFSELTVPGATGPVYITALGTGTGGAGTYTINAPQTIGSATTFTQRASLAVTTWYDQSGNGPNVTQGTTAQQPFLMLNCINGQPCVAFARANSTYLAGTLGAAVTQPWTISAVTYEYSAPGGSGALVIEAGGAAGGGIGATSGGNAMYVGAGTALTSSLSWNTYVRDNSPHIIEAVANNSATASYIMADSYSTYGTNPGAQTLGTSLLIGAYTTGSLFWDGPISEVGAWGRGFNSVDSARMCQNQGNAFSLQYTAVEARNVYACGGSVPIPPQYLGPCDQVTGGCAEAYSMTRAMTKAYTGNLFQLYNGTTTLDVGMKNGLVDMSTWSSFCGGLAESCYVSKVYAQINTANNLSPVINGMGVCTTAGTNACAGKFYIDPQTGLPVLRTIPSTIGQSGNSQAYVILSGGVQAQMTGVNGGTSDLTITVLATPMQVVGACCGPITLCHQWNVGDTPGTCFGPYLSYGLAFANQNCASSTVYCVGTVTELSADVGTYNFQQGMGAVVVTSYDSKADKSIVWLNGKRLVYQTPVAGAHTINVGTYAEVGAGGDLSQNYTTWFKEAAVSNSVFSAADVAAWQANTAAFYAGVPFP